MDIKLLSSCHEKTMWSLLATLKSNKLGRVFKIPEFISVSQT